MRGGAATNDLGEFRVPRLDPGSYLLLVVPRNVNEFGPRDIQKDANAPRPIPTFYPGVTSVDQAQPIVVERGRSVTSLDVVLADGVMSTITGTVIDVTGRPVTGGASVSASAVVKDLPHLWGGGGTSVGPDGTFRFRLPPGDYELQSYAFPHNEPRTLDGPVASRNQQFGSTRVSVSGDVAGVVIQLGQSARASGRLVFDGTSPLPAIPGDSRQQLRMMLMSADGSLPCRTGQKVSDLILRR